MQTDNSIAGKSIGRTVDILHCIADGVNSVTDIAENCGLDKSTIHRLLKVLRETHLVQQDPISRQYVVGEFITQFLSKPQISHEYLIRCASEETKRLSDLSGETIDLGVMTGFRNVVLNVIPSKHDLRVVSNTREWGYLHAGAANKALMSLLSNQQLRTALKYVQFEPLTENTVTRKEELMLQIKRIREEGYSISSGERTLGIMCIAAPIHDYVIPAFIDIMGPDVRLKPKATALADELKKSSMRISDNIKETFPAQ